MDTSSKIRSQLRTILTTIGAVLLSFSIGDEASVAMWVALAFPVVSAVWSWSDGHFNNIGSWLKKIVQTAVPLLVYYNVLSPEQTTTISGAVFVLISIFPSETSPE